MIKKWFYLFGLIFAFAWSINAQDTSSVLLQIGDEKVDADEFWAIYKKNNQINQQNEKTGIDEYLDLYINFKLKVKEAKDAGMDTTAAYLNELSGYRKQLVKSYLVVEEVNEKMVRTLYELMQTNLRAGHILLRLIENPLPADTLSAYQKAIQIREAILNGDYSFSDAAIKYSEDPSARDTDIGNGQPPRPGNKGDLGYFSVFDMVYPFEQAVFNLKKGEISNPVRTQFGYHLIYLTDKIPAIGEVKAAHIFIRYSSPSAVDSAKLRIDQLYDDIQNGSLFEDIALHYSDDKGSNEKGGELPWFTANRMVPEFIEAISKLNVGEISAPVKTNFGWHIIKFLHQRPVESFEKVKADIQEKLKRDVRSRKGEQVKIAQIKAENDFQEFPENLKEAIAAIDSDFYTQEFDATGLSNYSKPLFSLRDRSYSQYDFLSYIHQRKGSGMPENFALLLKKIFQEYVNQLCLDYEEEHLEEKYLDFRLIMNEYRDGILLFELMDKKIWSKASSDTLGLVKFFNANQKKYRWAKRARISVFHFTDDAYSNRVQNLLAKGKNDEEILLEVQNDSLKQVRFETLTIESGNISEYNKFKWKRDTFYPVIDESGEAKAIVVFREIIKPAFKALNDIRGLAIADYQSYLEKEWISGLRKRYEIVVDKNVLRTLKERGNR